MRFKRHTTRRPTSIHNQLSIIYVRFQYLKEGVWIQLDQSFNYLCEILGQQWYTTAIGTSTLPIIYVRFFSKFPCVSSWYTAFNYLCEIQASKKVRVGRGDYFQLSMWDSSSSDMFHQPNLSFQLSMWDSPHQHHLTRHLNQSFNYLCEIPYAWWGHQAARLTFNYLCEILEFCFGTYVWLITYLSIIYVRFVLRCWVKRLED